MIKKILIPLKALALRSLGSKIRMGWRPESIRTVLILRYDRIGDMVVTTPLFSALRYSIENLRIEVLASDKNAEIIKNSPDVDLVHVCPKSILGKILLILALRKKRLDLVIDLNHSITWRTLLEIRLIGSRYAVSPRKGPRYGVDPKNLTAYDKFGVADVNQPLTYVYQDLATLLSTVSIPHHKNYRVYLSGPNYAFRDKSLTGMARPIIGINLFGGRPQMCLREEDLTLIITELRRHGCDERNILILSAPNQKLRLHRILRDTDLSDLRVVDSTASVLDTCAVVSSLALLITPDTSLVHVACAFDVPLVAVYAGSAALFQQWKPVGQANSEVVFSQCSKSLDGYLTSELLRAIRVQMTRHVTSSGNPLPGIPEY
jgi:ADP-heptose:LPS heptosyltransferase